MSQEILLEIESAQMALAADAALAAGDPLKFTTVFRTEGTTRLNTTLGLVSIVAIRAGDRAGAAARIRQGLANLNLWLHAGHGYIAGLMSDVIPQPPGGGVNAISASDRAAVYEAYGWTGGRLGDFTKTRVPDLARLAGADKPADWPAFWLYPQSLRDAISAELAVITALQSAAATGSRSEAIAQRNAAGALLDKWNSRVRLFISYATDSLDRNPILSAYGHQPRREAGEAATEKPAKPGLPVYHAATMTATIPAMPQFARTIRAYVQEAGGTPRLAGTSLTTEVNLEQFAPLNPLVDNTIWVTGHDSDSGDGPPSEPVLIPKTQE